MAQAIRAVGSAALRGDVTIGEFAAVFTSESWDVAHFEPESRSFVYAIEALLSDHGDGLIDDQTFLAELAPLVHQQSRMSHDTASGSRVIMPAVLIQAGSAA